jgi:hypothetical protein
MTTPTPYNFGIEDVKSWAKTQLKFAQRDFAKQPNATRWNIALRTMYVYQQADFASRSACVDRAQLIADLAGKPCGHWDDIISRATTGKPVRDNLRDFAVASI